MIHCTITHTLPCESPADEVQIDLVGRFLDMDMDILASPRDDYLAYTNKIRQEYAHFPDEAFRKGRAGFLRSEIEKGKVFYLEENEGKNGFAMGNMRAELGMLEN
jgi:predicted metal-dependent HD superfamily phosphohydrolase